VKLEFQKVNNKKRKGKINMSYVEKLNAITSKYDRYISESMAEKIAGSEYNKKAIDFLFDAETVCVINFLGLNKPHWGTKKVNHYEVTLKNKKSEFTFNFWDSINNTEKGKKSTYDFYSVLACLSLNYFQNFDDFLREDGYEFKTESEYIRLKAVYLEIERQDKELRKLFTSEELERLSDIN
jgi:hypothetical protein